MQKVHVGWLQGLPHTRKKLEARSEETSVKKLSADNSKVNSAFQQKLCDETDQLMTYSLFLLFCCCLFRITEQEYCFKNENNEKNLEKNVYIKNSIIFRLMWNRQTANAKAMEAFW